MYNCGRFDSLCSAPKGTGASGVISFMSYQCELAVLANLYTNPLLIHYSSAWLFSPEVFFVASASLYFCVVFQV